MRAIFLIRVPVGLVVALVLTVIVLNRISWNEYVLTPAGAHPVAPLVEVQGARTPKDTGTIYFVDVFENRATQLDRFARWLNVDGWFHPHATYLPADVIVPPGSNDKTVQHIDRREMFTSQRIAAAVAEKQLHLPVVLKPIGVLVDNVYGDVPAAKKVDPADLIVGANGKPTLTIAALEAVMAPVKPGDTVHLTLVRGTQTIHAAVKTVADPQEASRAIIGVFPEQGAKITLPRKVRIDANGIGGPSAGLAFTLEVMEQLGANVTHGCKVAATGTINLDGTVGAIGGVEQKTWGVRDAGAQVFLVPVDGGNAKDAKKFAGPDLKIIPVTSIGQALRALSQACRS